MSERKITTAYDDPLSIIWLNVASQLGMRVVRDDEVFAAWDGAGTLTIGAAETLDADDSLAQMVFHELCHAITEGPESLSLPDWGLENDRPDHIVREHACLNLQASLAGEYGLRTFFATTTDFREYYDSLPPEPLASPANEAAEIASIARARFEVGTWAAPIHDALRRTSEILQLVAALAPDNSLWKQPTPTSPIA